MFALRQKYKNERNFLMQSLLKVIMNNLFRVEIRKYIIEPFKCKSEHWMQTEYDENDSDYWKIQNENYLVNFKKRRWFKW